MLNETINILNMGFTLARTIKTIKKELLKFYNSSKSRLIWGLIDFLRNIVNDKSERTINLCATDNAAHSDPYVDRLNDLLKNQNGKVFEIGITGPYSAGKTSILNTFQKRHQEYTYTTIALGSYNYESVNPDNEKSVPKEAIQIENIEKSIVKQLLYRVKSNKYGASRFRRIIDYKKHNFTNIFNVILLVLSFLCTVYAYYHWVELTESYQSISTFHKFTHNLTLWSTWIISLPLALIILYLSDLGKLIKKNKITRLNLLKGDITFENNNSESAFHIYLEEIIFYFHVTGSNVVIFEDLDRLNNPLIFEKLKELNKIINDSKDISQNVRFIYSIKDDLFEKGDRTKFFDAIIPIVPIANSGNAYPLIKQLLDLNQITDIKDILIREASIFVKDMRLIKNIVSEYLLYKDVLSKNPGLNNTKLFAFIIYKNCFSTDFAELQYGKGHFINALENIKIFKTSAKHSLKEELEKTIEKIKKARKEHIENLAELNELALFKLSQDNQYIGLTQIQGKPLIHWRDPDYLNDIIDQNRLNITRNNRGTVMNQTLQNEINRTFPEYKDRINYLYDKSLEGTRKIEKTQRYLETKISVLDSESISKIASEMNVETLFNVGLEKEHPSHKHLGLLYMLITEGYIDENYHHYLSHFLDGEKTFKEMLFLENLKTKKDNDPSDILINFAEIEKSITNNDCNNRSIINYSLINYLSEKSDNKYLIQAIISTFTQQPDFAKLLLDSLNSKIKNTEKWLLLVVNHAAFDWQSILNGKLSANNTLTLVVKILKSIPFEHRDKILAPNKKEISNYISSKAEISNYYDDTPELIELLLFLSVKFSSLEHVNPIFLDSIQEQALYKINLENLSFLVSRNNIEITDTIKLQSLRELDLVTNYTAKDLLKLVQLIIIEQVSLDNDQDISFILNHSNIDNKNKLQIIQSVNININDIGYIHDSSIRENLLYEKKIIYSWNNLNALYKDEDILNDLVSETFINTAHKDLIKSNFNDLEAENVHLVLDFIVQNGSLNAFMDLIELFQDLVNDYKISLWSSDQAKHLISKNILNTSEENLLELHECENSAYKIMLIQLLKMGTQYYSTDTFEAFYSHLEFEEQLTSLIDNLDRLTSESISNCLTQLGNPYNKIPDSVSYVYIDHTPLNTQLAEKLSSANLISKVIYKSKQLKLTAKRN